jgi:hypothetical protein
MPMIGRVSTYFMHAVHVSLEGQIIEFVRGLVADDPSVRARTADAVTDIVRDYSSDDAAALAYLLAALRISETDDVAQESQLNALAELAEWHDVPPGAVGLLAHVPRETITGSQVEHMRDLAL